MEQNQNNEYFFTMRIMGYHRVRVVADSYEEALEQANYETKMVNFGALEDMSWEVDDVS